MEYRRGRMTWEYRTRSSLSEDGSRRRCRDGWQAGAERAGSLRFVARSAPGASVQFLQVKLSMTHRQSHLSVFVAALFLTAALPSLARADTASSSTTLAPAQLEALAALVGETTSTVAQRIATDPSLVPLAAKAADARMQRKHTGKVLTIAGFTIFGVGTVIGFEMIVSSLRSSNCQSGNGGCGTGGNHGLPGLAVALVSEAIGLAMAIPGIVKLARQSEAETEASERYHPVPALRAEIPETPMRPTGFLVPLLSGTF